MSRVQVLALLLAVSVCGAPRVAPPSSAAPSAVSFAPLPSTAFRVEWDPVLLPTRLRPGERRAVDVTVVNASDTAWAACGETRMYAVRLAHRWFKGIDALVFADYGNVRTELAHSVLPGGRITTSVSVVAPETPGDYVVQFDLNQTGVNWFSEQGAARKYVLVKVE